MIKKNQISLIKKSLSLAVFLIVLRHLCDFLDDGEISIPISYFSIPLGGMLYFFTWFLVGIRLFKNQGIFEFFKSTISMISLLVIGIAVFLAPYPHLSGFFGANGSSIEDWFRFFIVSLTKGFNTLIWVVFLLSVTHKLILNRIRF